MTGARCACGLSSVTQTPEPLCRDCAIRYFRGLVRVGSALYSIAIMFDPPVQRIEIITPTPKVKRHQLTPEQADMIRFQYEMGYSQSRLARIYDCTPANIYLIVKGRSFTRKDQAVA